MRILVVDDEPAIRELVTYHLQREGYEVLVAETGPQALAMARSENPHLLILDLMLPDLDGFAVCRELRKWSQVPVLMLTARTDEVDRVVGFELGADDYVVKPFSPRELVARVKAILRRLDRAEEPAAAPQSFGRLSLDLERYEVRVDGRRVELTATEFQILKTLCSRPGRVFTRDELLDWAKGQDFFGGLRTIDVHVRHLRAKIGDDPTRPEFIETMRGVGYRLIPPAHAR